MKNKIFTFNLFWAIKLNTPFTVILYVTLSLLKLPDYLDIILTIVFFTTRVYYDFKLEILEDRIKQLEKDGTNL